MRVKIILYWTATVLIALETFAGGILDLTRSSQVVHVVTGLGYPVYVLTILGIFKIPGAIMLLLPGFLRLKEWAYAGICFELLGAVLSLAFCRHWTEVVTPLVLLSVALASWGLRPSNRILGGSFGSMAVRQAIAIGAGGVA